MFVRVLLDYEVENAAEAAEFMTALRALADVGGNPYRLVDMVDGRELKFLDTELAGQDRKG